MSLPWSPLRTIKLDANSLVDIACISFTCVQIFIIILFIHYQQHFTCNFGTIFKHFLPSGSFFDFSLRTKH